MSRHAGPLSAKRWLAGLASVFLALSPALAADKPAAKPAPKPAATKAAAAKPAPKPAAKASQKAPEKGKAAAVTAGFTGKDVKSAVGRDRWLLKVGAKPLPAALRKSIARGKVLPDSVEAQPVSSLMASQLPSYKGHGWVRVGTDLVLLSGTSKQVADIVPDVFE